MLIRFRADPKKVRVSIRKVEIVYIVSIADIADGRLVQDSSVSPRSAVLLALKAAEKIGIKGIDTGMQWAYDHPQYSRES